MNGWIDPIQTPESDDLAKDVAAIFELLSERQEPLGAEFEAVWDENAAELYQS